MTSVTTGSADVGGMLRARASEEPGRPALLAPGCDPLTYGALADRVARVAASLRSAGIGRADRVALMATPGPDTTVLLLGVMDAAVCVPLNPASTTDELSAVFEHLRPRIVIAGNDLPSAAAAASRAGIAVAELRAEPEGVSVRATPAGAPVAAVAAHPGDPALILHTSGTTSRPKVVELSHASLVSSALTIGATLELTSADRCLSMMPLFHVAGVVNSVLVPVATGGSLVALPTFDAERVVAWMTELEPTWYSASPPFHHAVLDAFRREPDARHSLRVIRSTAAPLSAATIADLEATFGVPVIESYGMTEAAGQLASNPMPPGLRKPGTVGLPTGGADVIIRGEDGSALPAGASGEVLVRGPTVVAGYAGDAEQTAECFEDGWFRSGDAGYVDDDGYLTLTGRVREVVNRGGEKVSPGEVEDVLLAHPAIARAVVFGVPHATLGQEVGAVLVAAPGATIVESQVRAFAAERLATFKVPTRIVVTDQIPAGAAGKPSRTAMARAFGLGHDATPYAAPRTPVEETLCQIVASVLGAGRVGVDDDFFDLGGHSLHATMVVSRVRQVLRVELPVRELFERRTVARLAAAVDALARSDDQPPAGGRAREGRELPLSYAQEWMWFLSQMPGGDIESTAFSLHYAYRITGPLDVPALERAFDELVARHAPMRTTFRPVRPGGDAPVQRLIRGVGPRLGHPLLRRVTVALRRPLIAMLWRDLGATQVVTPHERFTLEIIDLRDGPPGTVEARARELVERESARRFDVRTGPLFRAMLVRLGDEDHVLKATAHHLTADGWSRGLLARDLSRLYAAFRSGLDVPARPDVTYGDYVLWERDRVRASETVGHIAFWRRHLRGQRPLAFPGDRGRTERPPSGRSLQFEVPAQLRDDADARARELGATLHMVLLAAFVASLARLLGQTDITTALLTSGRDVQEVEDLVGLFARAMIVRFDASGDPTFAELVERVRRVALDSYANQWVPPRTLVEQVPELTTFMADRRQRWVLFQYLTVPSSHLELEGVRVDPVWEPDGPVDAAMVHDLDFEVRPAGDALVGRCLYPLDLLDDAAAARLSASYLAFLRSALEAPRAPLSELWEQAG